MSRYVCSIDKEEQLEHPHVKLQRASFSKGQKSDVDIGPVCQQYVYPVRRIGTHHNYRQRIV